MRIPDFDQAAKIVRKFGGERRLARAIGKSPSTVYRWSYPPPAGTNGIVPHGAVKLVKAAALRRGITLTTRDWMPEEIRRAVLFRAAKPHNKG